MNLMEVGSVASDLDVRVASIFRVRISRVSECYHMYRFRSNRSVRKKGEGYSPV
jgi:hypothetical protein